MVCEKDTGVEFDFEKDSIVPFVDGTWIRANGTQFWVETMASRLLCVSITGRQFVGASAFGGSAYDEEVGMLGAFAFDCRNCRDINSSI